MTSLNTVACLVGCSLAGSSFAEAPWSVANYFTQTRATASAESPFDLVNDAQGGNYSGLLPPRDDTYTAHPVLPDSNGEAIAISQLRYATAGNVISIFGSVSADVDPGDFMIAGNADAISSLTVQFDLPSGGTYRVIDGFLGGTHAGSTATLESGLVIFSFDSLGSQPNGETGWLAPGGYTLTLSAQATSEFTFFNGLFADASFWLDLEIIAASACPGDFNSDAMVDDADFTVFVAAYNILDCADPSMPPGCPADLNTDGFVDDADFVVFVAAYNELLCP